MFWNTCRLPEGWTVKNINSKHQSRPYNPDIAKTFFLANMIETWGRGIRKMKEECKAYGVAGPKIWGYPTDICVEFKNHEADMRKRLEKAKMAPKTEEMAPETEKMAPKTRQIAPETGEMAPKTGGIAPKTEEMAPETGEMAPKIGGIAPKTVKMALKTGQMAPETGGIAPETEKMAPETGEMAPKTGQIAPEIGGIAPKTVKVAPETSDPLQADKEILFLLKKNPKMTIPELMRETGKSVRTIKRNIKELKSAGFLKRIGPNKGGHWKVIKT